MRRLVPGLLLLLLGGWLSAPAWAATYWVSASGPGSTGTSCPATSSSGVTVEPSQFRTTINSGIACLGGGDTLVVKNGLYTEEVNVDNIPSGSASYAPATRIVAQNVRQPRIVPTGGACCGFSANTSRDAWIILEGFDVGGSVSSYTDPQTGGGINIEATRRLKILNNKFHHLRVNGTHDKSSYNEYLGNEFTVVGTVTGGNAGHPMYINGVGHLIDGNYIHHCRDADGGANDWPCYAIHARFVDTIPTSDWIVRNNRIEFAEQGILIVGSNMQVYNNVLTGMVNDALWNHAWGSTVYYGNTIVNNGGCAFYANEGASGVNATARNNIMYGNGNNTLTDCLAAGNLSGSPNLMNINPEFVGGGDHHVQAGSPAINFGANLGAPYNKDLEGHDRPLNEVTAGAYQFTGGAPPEPVPSGQCPNVAYNYQGYGTTAGGEGQTVATVTNNNNSGAGSLRNAVGSNRCVQFSSAMTITLASSLDLSGLSNLTIDGLTAPSPGITLTHCGIYLSGADTHDLIIRGLRIRMDSSSEGTCVTEGDGLQLISGPHHIIIDRNSVAGAVDENFSTAYYIGNAAHDLTVSRNFFTDPTQIGPNRVNVVLAAGGSQRISFHHNLMMDGTRLPVVGYEDATSNTSPDVNADVRNNISWMNDEGSKYLSGSKSNAINNYFIKAPAMNATTYEARAIGLEEPSRTQLYTSGNVGEPAIANLNSRGNLGSPLSTPTVTTTSALQGACDTVAQAGVFPRDTHDQTVLSRFTLTGCATGPEPTTPATLALYLADGNALDSGGHPSGPFHGTLTSGALATGAPIVSGQSFVFDGVDDVVVVSGHATLRPAAFGVAFWLISNTPPTTVGYCHAVAMGHGWTLGWNDLGHPFCWVNFGPTATTGTNVLTGTPQMLACAYDPAGTAPGVRLWVGNAQVAFTPTSAPLSYSGSENLTLGNSADGAPCAGRIDQMRLTNFAWTQSDIDAMFGGVTPTEGLSMTHSRYSVAHTAEGNWIGERDTNQAQLLTTPWGWRWSLHNASGATVAEHLRPFCRVNHLGTWGAWTELTTSFGALGLRYLTDSAVDLGTPTTPLLPLDGFTGGPGVFLADTVDTSSPYNAVQTITIPHGGQADQEIRLEASSPVVGGDLVQCQPRHQSGALLSGGYGTGDVNMRTLTLQDLGAPASVQQGGVHQGGTTQ